MTSPQVSAAAAITDVDAYRFLQQASFGPTAPDIARVKAIGYGSWIDEQYALQLRNSHLATAEASSTALHTDQPGTYDGLYSFWSHAANDPAQLRQRVAFALSQIFVISTNDELLNTYGRHVVSYMDMLTTKSDATYRDVLEAVALHPAMGAYLSHRTNRKENLATGRIPDENFAREVMQLMSIGLYELNDDGTVKLVNGKPKETYTAEDVKGLAKVFTGFSWTKLASASSLPSWRCFWRAPGCQSISQFSTPMSAYPEEHSTSVKNFLGVTIAAQSTPDPLGDLKIALDRLASHPNTAPFISKQLIQRLVTSNPSTTYVADITRVFRSTNGSLKAVVKAILLHPQARTASTSVGQGKLREPVLRLAQLLRAVPHTSDAYEANKAAGLTPFYLATLTDDPATQLGQTPWKSPSVFNFFRPGFKPPQTKLAEQGLLAPEMQITSETSVLGYANFVASILENGWGRTNPSTNKLDIRFDLSSWEGLATQPTLAQPQSLVNAVSQRLLGRNAPASLNTQMVNTIGRMAATTPTDRRRRVQAAILMVAVSPYFIVQQ